MAPRVMHHACGFGQQTLVLQREELGITGDDVKTIEAKGHMPPLRTKDMLASAQARMLCDFTS